MISAMIDVFKFLFKSKNYIFKDDNHKNLALAIP